MIRKMMNMPCQGNRIKTETLDDSNQLILFD